MSFTLRPYRRFPVHCSGTYTAGPFQGQDTVWNLSCTGWRLSRDLPLRPRETVSLTVTLPNAQRTVVPEAVVRWSRGQEFAVETVKVEQHTKAWQHQPRFWLQTALLGATLLPIFFACAGPKFTQHPDFKTRIGLIQTVGVVRPDSNVIRKKWGGFQEPMPEEAASVKKELTALVASELTRRGFEVKTWQTTGSSSLALAGNYVRDGGKYREIAQQAETDALVFVSFQGWTRSGSDVAGEVATKTLIAILTLGIVTQFAEPPGAALITMAFVDGATGEVLWERQTGTAPMLPPDFSQKELAELVEDLFAPFMK